VEPEAEIESIVQGGKPAEVPRIVIGLDARWIHVETDNNPGNFGGLAALNNGFNLGFRLNSLLAEDRWALGDNTVNELRVHFQRYVKEASPASTDPEHVYLSSGITTGWNPNQPQN